MAIFDNDWFTKGTGSDSWLSAEKARRQKRKENQDSQVAQQLKDEQSNVSAGNNPDGSPKPHRNLLQQAGGFIADAGKDIYNTTKTAVTSTVDIAKSIPANHQVQKNTDAVNANNKEWNKFMQTLPVGDDKAWSDPAVQEKLKEFKYKAALLQGKAVPDEDIPQSAKDAQKAVADHTKQFGTAPINGKVGAFDVGPDGKVKLTPKVVDPYQQYRDTAVSQRTKDDLHALQQLDAKKVAAADAETFLNIATLGIGTGAFQGGKVAAKEAVEVGVKQAAKSGIKAAAKEAIGTGVKEIAKNGAKDAVIGGAYGVTQTLKNNKDNKAGLSDYARNILLGSALGALVPVVPGAAKSLLRGADETVGKTVSEQVSKRLSAKAEDTAMRRSLKQIGENGIFGTIDKSLSRAGKKVAYAVGDAAENTKLGSKVIGLKDSFMNKWVSNFSPLYKVLKRSDFEGTTTGAYAAAREAIGNSNRSLSYAQDFVENNPNMQQLTATIAATDKDLVKGRAAFDEYAAVKSDLDLAAAGKKTFSKAKLADLNARAEAAKPFEDGYKNLVGFYKDLNDFRLDNGLISKEQHQMFKDEPFDYVRQQRELPDWMLDKPGGKSGGSKASIAKSEGVQKRNQYASGEVLSPMETAMKTAQLAHVEAYRNKAAKTVFSLLDEAGDAKLVRTTDMVREKQALITQMKANSPIVRKLDKTVRSNVKSLKALRTELDNLNQSGLKESLKGKGERMVTKTVDKNGNTVGGDFTPGGLGGDVPTSQAGRGAQSINQRLSDGERELLDSLGIKNNPNKLGPKDTRAFLNNLISQDPATLKTIRAKIENRNSKLGPLMDTVEVMNRDLHDMHGQQAGLYQAARDIHTTVNKGQMTSLSFLNDGVENVAKIDPAIASAIHNWDKQSQNVLGNVLRFSNNVFKYGTTGANVGFALPNFVADQASMIINGKAVMRTANPVNFVHSLFMTLGKPLTTEDADILRSYLAGNKGQLSINQYTKQAAASKAANDLVGDAASKGAKLYTNFRHPTQGLKYLFDKTEGAVGVTENLTRIQNFRGATKQAIHEGLDAVDTKRVANLAARENSVDFLEMGDYGKVINQLIPYFNAGIQGTRTMLRNATEHPATFMAKTAAIVGVPVAATTVWNTGTEDRKAIYDTIPEYVKQTNFIVITPGAKWDADKKKWDGVVLLKKPQGFKEFAEPVRKFIEYKANDPKGDLADFFKSEGGSVATDFVSQMGPIDFTDQNKFLSSVTPQILKPTAEAILNKNFFQGTDIVKGSMADLPPEDQKYEDYSRLTAHIGALFNTSPLKVDTWIKETFGEVGTNAQNLADRVNNDNPKSIGGRSLQESITRRFSGAPGGADTDAFYESYKPALSARTAASSKVTELVKAGRINEAKRRAEEYNATVPNRFRTFMQQNKKSPTYDASWDDKINGLVIKTSDSAFTARRKQK
jgi:hypothetical protein